jgi:hypothetical protein
VALLESKLGDALPAAKPDLRLVVQTPAIHRPEPRMDAVTRESHIRLITSLRRFYKPYGMDLIVNQALMGKGSLDDLSDDELVQLQRDIDRARECIADGISFEEAGLLRSGHDLMVACA